MFLLCLVPFFWLVWDLIQGQLSANPIEDITHRTGDWALRFLLITLAVTPLKRLSGKTWLLRLRRMLGLYAFFYALLHFLTYLWLDQQFLFAEILVDIGKRPYITVGFTAFILLIPLAATSNRYAMRRLGRRWQTLHRSIYVIAAFGVLHYLWLVKADSREPLVYGLILLALLGIRAWWQRRDGRPAAG
ncbi:protein-methionine-sulfoxide reductase heme-binding subunit MsrQ [Sulfuriflexus sp.]|uniref:sulfite oxidase heme-binding subunit YedZ n=1 Tax=Sulfuriflexus sp. TaxID=2015443 RepID=UPI0028CF88F7|nr:protein-methionine-sulfoxide reductase heme-binding subunit MsrQ [Sulfuriflexus sp.]MDT8403291.1 protein-methionine-sulfoxide reductase heme-binding subunit MsrQ [Sulfuriflexus sp.]